MLGDILDKVAMQEGVTPYERSELLRLMNRLHEQSILLDSMMGVDGVFSVQDLFARRGTFEVYPHAASSLHGISGGSLTVPNSTWTVVAPTDDASGAHWVLGEGMRLDATNGRIYVDGVKRQSVLLIAAYVIWAGSVAGERLQLEWEADDGSAVIETGECPSGHTDDFQQFIIHARIVPSDVTWYRLRCAQYSGVDQVVNDVNFVVMRIR